MHIVFSNREMKKIFWDLEAGVPWIEKNKTKHYSKAIILLCIETVCQIYFKIASPFALPTLWVADLKVLLSSWEGEHPRKAELGNAGKAQARGPQQADKGLRSVLSQTGQDQTPSEWLASGVPTITDSCWFLKQS